MNAIGAAVIRLCQQYVAATSFGTPPNEELCRGQAFVQEWDRLVEELITLGLLTNLDRAALAAYGGAYALWTEATEAIQKYGAMIKSPKGFPIQSPYLAIANRRPRS